ncbi:MAG: 16S rRNA (guanine(966)-N(2))-methyltransferase RsmD [Bacillota bacterium]
MRIVAGRFRGRRLQGPRHPGLRPTAEKVRKAVFDILGPRVAGAVVLDLFAGAGGLGLEALSRGAKQVIFVERDRRALDLLRRNLRELGLAEGEEVRVVAGDVRMVLSRLAGAGERFDLVLADPPYAAASSAYRGRTFPWPPPAGPASSRPASHRGEGAEGRLRHPGAARGGGCGLRPLCRGRRVGA